MKRFAILGAGGNVGTRHLEAIHQLGHRVVAASDPAGATDALRGCFPDAWCCREPDRLWYHLEQLPEGERVDYVSVCTPNDLHAAHALLALKAGADVVCEKPLVIEPAHLDELARCEVRYGRRVHGILQLRYHPSLAHLRDRLDREPSGGRRSEASVTIVQPRDPAYFETWKGSEERSGGLLIDMGIHFLDLLVWLFGACQQGEVHVRSREKVAGRLDLERACVRFLLSTDAGDLPAAPATNPPPALRRMTVDGKDVDLSNPGMSLHAVAYREVLAGRGLRIEDLRPSLELACRLGRGPAGDPRPRAPAGAGPEGDGSRPRGGDRVASLPPALRVS